MGPLWILYAKSLSRNCNGSRVYMRKSSRSSLSCSGNDSALPRITPRASSASRRRTSIPTIRNSWLDRRPSHVANCHQAPSRFRLSTLPLSRRMPTMMFRIPRTAITVETSTGPTTRQITRVDPSRTLSQGIDGNLSPSLLLLDIWANLKRTSTVLDPCRGSHLLLLNQG